MIEKIKELAKEKLAQSDDAHGYEHAKRVAGLAGKILGKEGGDKLVVLASCYMHDWCSGKGRAYHVSEEAMSEIKIDLEKIEFPKDKIELVVEVIRHHEDYDFKKMDTEFSIECQILQDADRLDSLGAIGIGRCFYTTGILGQPMGTMEETKRLEENYHVGQITSAIRQFYVKLLYLKDSMNTQAGKSIAEGRHNYMVKFLERLSKEWSGEI